MTRTTGSGPVLSADQLSIIFDGKDAAGHAVEVRACNKVSLDLHAGEIVALVGESGSGKTTLARAFARIFAPDEGEIRFHGERITGRPKRSFYRHVQLVYQDPFASLNSLKTIRHILGRTIRIHKPELTRSEVTAQILQLLEMVALTPAEDYIDRFPSSLSGGQRQRISIARALAVEPDVILADEPTSMLDVSIRLDVLNLLDAIRRERGVTILYITHDIASARYVSDRMCVMYSGELVESGPTEEVVSNPRHPYTQLLLASAPDPSRTKPAEPGDTPDVDEPADPSQAISGCRFNPRCPAVMDRCTAEKPPLFTVGEQQVKCWLYDGVEAPTRARSTDEEHRP
ncbi:ABC transporter ATP-binding protein [Propioniciclava soli]|uniref:ABC transporter ATP-binding protein n=1 Tax=Propioniciclava soli TaxID=2775081 RepID=UPI001E31C423|nr:ABC transporter ATP-binding protein [Propioniciclava soli]